MSMSISTHSIMRKIQIVINPPALIPWTIPDIIISWERVSIRISSGPSSGARTSVSGRRIGTDGGSRIRAAVDDGGFGITGLSVEGTPEEPEGTGLTGRLSRVVVKHGPGD
jgi:hypothetical protein